MSSNTCGVCGEQALVEEGGHVVCIECGTLCNEGQTTLVHNTHDDDGYRNFVTTEIYTSGKRKYASEPEGLYLGRVKTAEFCDRLKMESSMKESATRNFVKLYYDSTFKNTEIHVKMALAGVCAYIEARVNNYPVMIRDMKSLLQSEDERIKFQRVLLKVKKLQDITFQHMSLVEIIMAILKKSTFPETLFNKTIDVVKLCEDFWRKQSHCADTLVGPCAYLSWLSWDLCDNPKTTFIEFCYKYSIRPLHESKFLLAAVRTKLLKLAKCIPWVDEHVVKKRNVTVFLSDIISCQRSLFNKAFKNCEEESTRQKRKSRSETIKTVDEIETEQKEKDEKICRDNPNLHNTEIYEDEFQDEMHTFIKTEEEIDNHQTFHVSNSNNK